MHICICQICLSKLCLFFLFSFLFTLGAKCHGALALPCICKRRGFLCLGSCILDLYMGIDRQRLLLLLMVFIYIDDTSRHDTGHLEISSKIT